MLPLHLSTRCQELGSEPVIDMQALRVVCSLWLELPSKQSLKNVRRLQGLGAHQTWSQQAPTKMSYPALRVTW